MTKITKPEIKQPGANVWPFHLGDRVRDKINGLEGRLTSRFYHVTGCDRFIIELDAKDGKTGEMMHVDAGRVELLEAHPELHRDEIPDIHVKLGDKVKSLLTGVVGYAAVIHVPLYGAIQVDVQPVWDGKEKKLPEGYFVDAGFCEVTEPYTPRPKAETDPAAKPQTKTPGCHRMGRGATVR